MLELSLHILDVLENSVEAGASRIALAVEEDLPNDLLRITITDDGKGMDRDTLEKVKDPFFTTRSSRRVGLGLPLLAAAAERSNGGLSIQSERGKGTTVVATFQHTHIDRPPLGDMATTLLSVILGKECISLHYRHQVDERTFEVDTEKMRARLGDVPFSHPIVRRWLREYLTEGLSSIRT